MTHRAPKTGTMLIQYGWAADDLALVSPTPRRASITMMTPMTRAMRHGCGKASSGRSAGASGGVGAVAVESLIGALLGAATEVRVTRSGSAASSSGRRPA